MEEKTISGSIAYTMTFKDGKAQLEFERSTQNELAAVMISKEMIRFNREFLHNLKNLTGKDHKTRQERILKMTQTHFGLGLVVQDIANQLFLELKQQEELEKSAESNLPLPDGDQVSASVEEDKEA